MTKKWPENNKPISDCTDLLDSVVDLYKEMTGDCLSDDAQYTGYPHGGFLMSSANWLEGSDLAKFEVRKRLKESDNLDPIDLVIRLAYQLGMEQGGRLKASKKY